MIKGKKGQESNFKNMLFAFILIGLFGMLIMTAVVTVGNTYGMNTTEIAGGSLSISKFNASISSIEGNAQAMNDRFAKQSVWSAIAGVVVEGIFGIAIDIFKMMTLPFGLVQDIMIDNFGVPAYVTGIVMALFIFSIIFSIWRLLKIGD